MPEFEQAMVEQPESSPELRTRQWRLMRTSEIASRHPDLAKLFGVTPDQLGIEHMAASLESLDLADRLTPTSDHELEVRTIIEILENARLT